jgi:hypothetical protein
MFPNKYPEIVNAIDVIPSPTTAVMRVLLRGCIYHPTVVRAATIPV